MGYGCPASTRSNRPHVGDGARRRRDVGRGDAEREARRRREQVLDVEAAGERRLQREAPGGVDDVEPR
jgi:hypothetical protein